MATYLYSDMTRKNGRSAVLKNVNHSITLNEVEFKIIQIDVTEYMYQNLFIQVNIRCLPKRLKKISFIPTVAVM